MVKITVYNNDGELANDVIKQLLNNCRTKINYHCLSFGERYEFELNYIKFQFNNDDIILSESVEKADIYSRTIVMKHKKHCCIYDLNSLVGMYFS